MVLGDVFGPSDALVAIAAIGFVGTMVGQIIAARRSKRTEVSAAQAVHNTQPNGHLDEAGERSGPSPYDSLVASHEYMIGQIHGAREQAEQAAHAADGAQAAVKQNDAKTDLLAQRVEAGFAEAKAERGAINHRLDTTAEDGATFVEAAGTVVLGILGRLDAIDGQQTVEDLRKRLGGQA